MAPNLSEYGLVTTPGCTSDSGAWPTPPSSTLATCVEPFIRKSASLRGPGSVGINVTGTVQTSVRVLAVGVQLTVPAV